MAKKNQRGCCQVSNEHLIQNQGISGLWVLEQNDPIIICQCVYPYNTTTLAGGKHGHVGLIMKEILYKTLDMVTPWEDMDDTDPIPQIYTNDTADHH